jgi:hypothetical protein
MTADDESNYVITSGRYVQSRRFWRSERSVNARLIVSRTKSTSERLDRCVKSQIVRAIVARDQDTIFDSGLQFSIKIQLVKQADR